MLAIGVEVLNETLQLILRVVDSIGGEIQVVLHVIDVVPHRIKRNLSLLEALHYVFQLRDVLVAPSTLMETCTEK